MLLIGFLVVLRWCLTRLRPFPPLLSLCSASSTPWPLFPPTKPLSRLCQCKTPVDFLVPARVEQVGFSCAVYLFFFSPPARRGGFGTIPSPSGSLPGFRNKFFLHNPFLASPQSSQQISLSFTSPPFFFVGVVPLSVPRGAWRKAGFFTSRAFFFLQTPRMLPSSVLIWAAYQPTIGVFPLVQNSAPGRFHRAKSLPNWLFFSCFFQYLSHPPGPFSDGSFSFSAT